MGRIKIESLTINGFKFDNQILHISMSENNINTVYGPNGYGKTTLLNIIYAIFEKDEDFLILENVKDIVIEYTDGYDLHTVTIYRKKSNEYFWKNFDSSELSDLKVLYITTERGLSSYRRKITEDDFKIFFEQNSSISLNLNTPYKDINKLANFLNGKSEEMIINDIIKSKNVHVQNINMSVIESLILNYEHEYKNDNKLKQLKYESLLLKNTLELIDTYKNSNYNMYNSTRDTKFKQERNLNKKYIKLIKEICSESSEIIVHTLNLLLNNDENKSKYIYSLLDEYEQNRIEDNNISTVFNNFTNKELVIEDNEVKIRVGKVNHSLDKLSHGERQLLTFLVFLNYIGKTKDLILIDEPCIALDTDWQEELLELFKSICESSSFIIATHSPYISIKHTSSIVKAEIN